VIKGPLSGNNLYFVHEALDIFHFQVKALQKASLLENETEYFEFL
jgi:hypothetical protein